VPALTETEHGIQGAILEALVLHPRVAWAHRMNTGATVVEAKTGRRFIRYGFKGMADITGQLTDGRRLEIEVKRPGKRPTGDQVAFIAAVNKAGGVAGVACSVEDAFAIVEGR